MKHVLLFLTFLSAQASFSQSQQNDLAFTLGTVTIPVFDQQKIGFDMSVRYYVSNQFSVGGNFYTASPRYNHGFGFDTDRTLMNIYGVSVPLQYDVINTDKITLGFGFSNGIMMNVLRNRNDVKEVESYDPDTGIGSTSMVPKRLKIDNYYTLTPYGEVSVKMIELDKKEGLSLFVTSKFGYQNAFGKGTFSKSNDFRNYVLSLGFTIKGTAD